MMLCAGNSEGSNDAEYIVPQTHLTLRADRRMASVMAIRLPGLGLFQSVIYVGRNTVLNLCLTGGSEGGLQYTCKNSDDYPPAA